MTALSARQIAALRHLEKHALYTVDVRTVHQGTLWSLLHRKLVHRIGDGVTLTALGERIVQQYNARELPLRKNPEAALSERCLVLLKVSRTFLERTA